MLLFIYLQLSESKGKTPKTNLYSSTPKDQTSKLGSALKLCYESNSGGQYLNVPALC